MPLSQPLNDNRRRVCNVLLSSPEGAWTVRELTVAVPTVAAGAVRDAFNQLLAVGIMRQVPHQRALTAALSDKGRQILTRLLHEDESRKEHPRVSR